MSARSHRSSRVKPSAGPNFCLSSTREVASVAAFDECARLEKFASSRKCRRAEDGDETRISG